MNKLREELDWLTAEKERLRDRYINEMYDEKAKIIRLKLIEIRSMAWDVRFELAELEGDD